MKLLAPWWIKHAENEDEKFFICFLWLIAKEEGFNVEYYMHGADISVFFKDHKNTYYGKVKELQSVKKWIWLGKANKIIYTYHFRTDDREEVEWEITNDKHKAMWMYILAKKAAGELMHKKHLGVQQRWLTNRLPRPILAWLKDR